MLVTDDTFQGALDYLSRFHRLGVDVETNGLLIYHGHRVSGIAISADGQGFYFPFRHSDGNLPFERMSPIIEFLNKPRTIFVGHNLKFDLQMLAKEGLDTTHPRIEDTIYAAYLMNENEPSFGLKPLSDKYLGTDSSKEQKDLEAVLKELGLGKEAIGDLPASQVADYAAQDVLLSERLLDFYLPHLDKWGLLDMFHSGCKYLRLLTRIEQRGFRMDRQQIMDNMASSGPLIEAAKQAIWEEAGSELNLNSPKQLKNWLLVESTAKKIITPMAPFNPAIQKLLDYRNVAKQNSTYYTPFLNFMDADDILHPNLSITGTVTGRLSASKPNVLAIPRDDGSGRNRVKEVFIARDGYNLIEADYSQAEMRIMCMLSGERNMTEIINSGQDIHQATADMLAIDRQSAKSINFGILYGIGARHLAEAIGKSVEEAKEILDRYNELYPAFRRFSNQINSSARVNHYIRMRTGRMRHYNGKCRCDYPGCHAEHTALSNLIQGTSAEITRITMVRCDDELAHEDIHQLLQVYDSIIFEAPTEKVESFLPRIKHIMEDFACDPPMRVDIKYGNRWGSTMTKWDSGD